MAEASPNDSTPDREAENSANPISTTYLQKSADVAKALKALRNQGAKVRLTFENEPTTFSARILDVIEGDLLLEDLQPRSALKLMTARRRFAFSCRASGVYLYSEDNQVSRIDEDRGVPYFRVPIPVRVLYQQRRRTARVQVPRRNRTRPAMVTVYRAITPDKDHGDTLEGRMLDVSAGGCRIAIPGPIHPPMTDSEILRGALIRIPGVYDLKAAAVVRKAKYNKLTRKVTCGIEFTEMTIADRRRLAQFIHSLSREAD